MDEDIVNEVLRTETNTEFQEVDWSESELEPFFGDTPLSSSVTFLLSLLFISNILASVSLFASTIYTDWWSYIPLPQQPMALLSFALISTIAGTGVVFWLLFKVKWIRYHHKIVVPFASLLPWLLASAILVLAYNIMDYPKTSATLFVWGIGTVCLTVFAVRSHYRYGPAAWAVGDEISTYQQAAKILQMFYQRIRK